MAGARSGGRLNDMNPHTDIPTGTPTVDPVADRQALAAADPAADPFIDAPRPAASAPISQFRLRLRYRARGGPDGAEPARWRTVDPVGLVEAGGHWYLLATRDGAERTYRLSRVEDVEELDEPARGAPGTDLQQVWEQRRAAFLATRPATTVTVRVRADRLAALAAMALGVVEEQAASPDTLQVAALFGDALHAERVLWSLGADVEVLDPAPLRATLAARAAAVAALYR